MPKNIDLKNSWLALCVLALWMAACNHAVSEALTAKDAEIDKDITLKLQAPEGPDVYLSLQQSARNNVEDAYGLAREACQIMATHIQKDQLTFKLIPQEKAVLQRLEEELENTDHTYREWIRLAVKFSFITGFIRYRKEPEKYDKKWLFGEEPDADTPLETLEQQHWELIDNALSGKKPWECPQGSREKSRGQSLVDLLTALEAITKSGHFVFPCFQPLDVEYFDRICALGYRPIAVSLEDGPMDADNYWMSRGNFLLHDARHASDFLVINGKNITEDTMRKQHPMTGYLFSKRNDINSLNPGLFKAVTLVLFYATHESAGTRPIVVFLFENGTKGLFDWPSHQKSSSYPDPMKYYDWPGLSFSSECFNRLTKGIFRDLMPDYGFLIDKNHQNTLDLAGLFLTAVSQHLCKQYAASGDISLNDFQTAVDTACQDFAQIRNKYEDAKERNYVFRCNKPGYFYGPLRRSRNFMFGNK